MGDLIEQLRFCAESESENYPFLPVSDNIMALAADRIKELEKENEDLRVEYDNYVKHMTDDIEQLKKENKRLSEESRMLTIGVRTINRRGSHQVPESITGDDEPCYWQREEWVDYIFDLCENVELLLTNNKE